MIKHVTLAILTCVFSGELRRAADAKSRVDAVSKASIRACLIKPLITQIQQSGDCGYNNQVSSLGIGLVIAPVKFQIYCDSLLNEKVADWDVYKDAGSINLCSKFFKPDYGIMHFVCIAKSERAYTVLVNFSEIKYVPNTKDYAFKTWKEYIFQSLGIRPTSSDGSFVKNYRLRTTPNDNGDTLVVPNGHDLFCAMEVRGDWVKVRYDCFGNNDNSLHAGEPCQSYIGKCKNALTGWLRWRRGNELLIDIVLLV